MPTKPTFLYDADCGPCARFERLASFLDASHTVDFIPISEAAGAGMLDSVPSSLWYSSARMIDSSGEVTSGGDAIVALLGHLPTGRVASGLVARSPLGMSAARRIYGVMSRLHETSCASTVNGSARPTRLSGAWSSQ